MSTQSDSSQPTSQTPSQPSASAAAPATGTTPAASAATAGSTAAPASTATSTAPAETKPTEGATPPATGETKPAAAATGQPASETKPAEGTKPAEAQRPAAATIPETYTITPPQGVKLEQPFVDAMLPVFKEAGLTQDQVNKLATTFLGFQAGLPKAMLARDLEATLKDPDLGGMRWGQTQGFVNEALGAFTTPEFRSKLEKWGIANDLEFVRVFASIGRAMRGDTPSRGQPNTAGEESLADRIYGRAKKVGNAE